MAVGLALQLAQARTVIAALTATTAGPGSLSTFTSADGLLEMKDEAPTLDRRFEVIDPDQVALTDEVSPDAGQFRARFAVEIRYDLASRVEAGTDRIAEDREQIMWALCSRANYAAGVQLVRDVGSSRSGDDGLIVMRLEFECTFRRSF